MLTPEMMLKLEKPWMDGYGPGGSNGRGKRGVDWSRVGYYLTYGVMMLGVVAGALRCWAGWRGVMVMKGNLCPVLDEVFEREEGVFGESGTFFREVEMSGFG